MGCIASVLLLNETCSPPQGFAKRRGIRVSILAGDVHLACYGQVRRLRGSVFKHTDGTV